MNKKIDAPAISVKDAWESIEWGIRLCSRENPHMKDIVLTPEQKSILIKLYCDKRFVVYCSKFEEYFKINQEYVRQSTPEEYDGRIGNGPHIQTK